MEEEVGSFFVGYLTVSLIGCWSVPVSIKNGMTYDPNYQLVRYA
jgi:hypothetical protein